MSEAQDTKLKRGYFHDYHAPFIYLITVTVMDREPLWGSVVDNMDHASVELTKVGKELNGMAEAIANFFKDDE